MWPEEKESSLDEDSSLLGNGGGSGSANYPDDSRESGGNVEGPSTLAIEAAPSAAGDGSKEVSSKQDGEEAGGVSEEGMGADGGLREEWDAMTVDEKVGPVFLVQEVVVSPSSLLGRQTLRGGIPVAMGLPLALFGSLIYFEPSRRKYTA